MSIPAIVALAIAAIIGLVLFGIIFSLVGAWVKAIFNGAPVGIGKLIALKFASIPYNLIVDARITAVRAGIALTADQIASHFQAGGNVVPTVQALIAAQKAGIEPTEAVAFARRCRDVHGLAIEGLMCIPPADENPGPHFALLEKLAREAGVEKLSMGMSGDYETAVAFGATSVRVGSAIFGSR